MKKLQFWFGLAATMLAINVNAEAWNCGTLSGGSFSNLVQAVVENDTVLRIYKGGNSAASGGRMADFAINYSPIGVTTTSPWDTAGVAWQIKHVVVENGVSCIGDYAFYTMPNLVSLTLPRSMQQIGDSILPDMFGSADNGYDVYIYCSNPEPPSCPGFSMEFPFPYCNNESISVYVPNEAAKTAYEADGFWRSVAGEPIPGVYQIFASVKAAAVVTVPQDSITDTKVTLHVEYLPEAERYELSVTNQLNLETEYYGITFNAEGKPEIQKLTNPSNGSAPARRKPILLRDTVRRSTESLQIDITDLAPETPYAYSVDAVNVSNTVIMAKEGTFHTAPQDLNTAFDEFTNEEMRKGKNIKIIRDGQIFILRDGECLDITGRKIN